MTLRLLAQLALTDAATGAGHVAILSVQAVLLYVQRRQDKLLAKLAGDVGKLRENWAAHTGQLLRGD